MLIKMLTVFVGGGIGSILRFVSSAVAKHFWGTALIGTLMVNIVGCFLIGYFYGVTSNKLDFLPPSMKLLITVGFLGGLTTFSTFNLEVFSFVKDGRIMSGLIYVFASCFLGLLFTFAGYAVSNN